jgi:glycosyltransferase involved in cell wall biosynthesis
LKIAFANARFRPDAHDGPTAHARQFVQNVQALGHEVWTWPAVEHPLARQLPPGRVTRILRLRDLDVVYIRLEHGVPRSCTWAVGVKRALLGNPLMVWEFNTVPEFGQYAGLTSRQVAENVEGFRRFGRGCDLAVCVSRHLADYVSQRLGIERTLVVPNGSDPELFRPDAPVVRHLRDGDPDTLNVLWIGSAYVPWHDFEMLGRAAELSWRRSSRANVVFHLIGPRLDGLADMPPNVHYQGSEDYERLPRWMSGMHVGLCLYRPGPADYASPLKVFDYMASGLAVVATAQSQTVEILGELGTPDLLVSPGDAEGLADILHALAADRRRVSRIGVRARELSVRKYTWQRTITGTVAEIERLLSAREGRAGQGV